MRVLALEAYHAGSHRAFLDGWVAHSRHDWTLLTCPGHHWKWRMRHAAASFAEQLAGEPHEPFDAVFATDMLNLAEFRGLAPPAVAAAPAVAYFHETQLTYPNRTDDPRDVHFALTNLATALAAKACWFNSGYHRDAFLAALGDLLNPMPGQELAWAPQRVAERSAVAYPGVDPLAPAPPAPGPLCILWNARWEHDKDPERFFAAIEQLAATGADFRLNVCGESFRDVPAVFASARERFAGHIRRWGYQSSRAEYESALREADVVVSTARHEFFGLGVVEAVAAGARPLLPPRLAYPELFGPVDDPARSAWFYDGTAEGLAAALAGAVEAKANPSQCPPPTDPRALVERFAWPRRAKELDAALEAVADAV